MTVQGPVKEQQPDGMSHGAGPPAPLKGALGIAHFRCWPESRSAGGGGGVGVPGIVMGPSRRDRLQAPHPVHCGPCRCALPPSRSWGRRGSRRRAAGGPSAGGPRGAPAVGARAEVDVAVRRSTPEDCVPLSLLDHMGPEGGLRGHQGPVAVPHGRGGGGSPPPKTKSWRRRKGKKGKNNYGC